MLPFYRLTKAVQNPDYKIKPPHRGAKLHTFEKIPEFPAGTGIVILNTYCGSSIDQFEASDFPAMDFVVITPDGDTFRLMKATEPGAYRALGFAELIPAMPRTLAEQAIATGMPHHKNRWGEARFSGDWSPVLWGLLEKMMEDGRTNMDEIGHHLRSSGLSFKEEKPHPHIPEHLRFGLLDDDEDEEKPQQAERPGA